MIIQFTLQIQLMLFSGKLTEGGTGHGRSMMVKLIVYTFKIEYWFATKIDK